jgi:hypothetical protein
MAFFCMAHGETLKQELALRHDIPSYVTFRDILTRIDDAQLVSAFNNWARGLTPIKQGSWISGDGKALSSTLTDSQGNHQDFMAVVSLFSQESGLVLSLERYSNRGKESGEMDKVRFLIGQLKEMGAIIRLDALHTQKKR